MIVVKVEMWPLGKEEGAREIGRAHISNDGTGDRATGHYNVKLLKSAEYAKRLGGTWKAGRVEGFPRLTLGPWDLLYRALVACVSVRNRVTLPDVPAPVYVEIVAPNGQVSYRRMSDHPDVQEALRHVGYSVRRAEEQP